MIARSKTGFFSKRSLYLWSALYILVFLLSKVSVPSDVTFGVFNTISQVVFDIIIVCICVSEASGGLRSAHATGGRPPNYNFLMLLAASFVFSGMADILYGYTVNIRGIIDYGQTALELWINIPYVATLIFGALALQAVDGIHDLRSRILSGVTASAYFTLVLSLVFSEILNAFAGNQTRLIHIVCIFADALLLASCVSVIISKKATRGVRQIAAGFFAIFSFGILLQITELRHSLTAGMPLEFFWAAGQVFIIAGLNHDRKQIRVPHLNQNIQIGISGI